MRTAFEADPVHRIVDALMLLLSALLFPLDDELQIGLFMALGIQLWKPIYRNRIVVSTLDDVPKLIVAAGTVSFLGVVVFGQGWDATRILGFCFFVPAMVILGRAITNVFIRRWRIRKWWARKRTVILGSGETGWDLVRIADAYPELGLETVAVADKKRRDNGDNPYGVDVEVLEKGGLKSLLTRARAQTLIVADSVYGREELLNMLRDCARLDTEVLIVPILTEYVSMGDRMDRIYSYPVLRVRRAAYRSFEWKLKRPIGLILSGLALIALSPIFAVLAILLKIEDPKAPVIFRQIRIGVDEKPFELFKFRSMTPRNTKESDTTWNIAGDQRITRLGAFMRKYSLDELPQIVNVFKGDMALVGPRPERPAFVERFKGEHVGYRSRHRVPVGLTGWAAANGLRGDTSIRERVQFDNFYIENWSLWLDFKIMLLTVSAVFKGTGA